MMGYDHSKLTPKQTMNELLKIIALEEVPKDEIGNAFDCLDSYDLRHMDDVSAAQLLDYWIRTYKIDLETLDAKIKYEEKHNPGKAAGFGFAYLSPTIHPDELTGSWEYY